MGQATVDLPDPSLSASPAEAQSADDLLSQLAGNEIDRLLAETDDAPEVLTPAVPAPVPAGSEDLDAVLADAAADRAAAAERSALQETLVVPKIPLPPDLSPRIELGESSKRLPLFFRPLEWLSAPLDPWPDQLRELMGKVGLMTFINALAVLAYVMYRRHHH